MRTRTLLVMTVALLATSAVAAAAGAAGAAESSGHYYSARPSKTETKLPDGNTSVKTKYYMMTQSDQSNDPTSNAAGNCSSDGIVSKAGKTLSGHGICHMKDGSGDGTTFSWKIDAVDTAKCPVECGSWKYTAATGKFKGLTGSGTFVVTHTFKDGANSGTTTSTYTMP